MSLVTVHGPNTMYTDAPGVITSSPAGAKATQDATNGLKFTFALVADSPRADLDFSWAFPPDGTPHAQTVESPTPVTYATPGTKTATLTVTNAARTISNKALTGNVATLTSNAHGFLVGQTVVVAGVDAVFNGTYVITAVTANTFSYAKVNADVTSAAATGTAAPTGGLLTPAAGSYTITVNAVTGRPKGTGDDGGGGQQQQQQLAPAPNVEVAAGDVDVAYDPGAHNISEVLDFARENRDQIPDLITTERAGKNRSTLISQLEELRA
jgi:hypothetical protein